MLYERIMNLRICRLLQLLIITTMFSANIYAIGGEEQIETDATLKNPPLPRERLANVVRRTTSIEGDKIKIISAYANPAIGRTPHAAAYVSLHNTNDTPVVLSGIMVYPSKEHTHSPIAKHIEVRANIIDNQGNPKGIPVGKVSIPAGEKFIMKPGGNFILLKGLRQKLEEGMNIHVLLHVKHLDAPLAIDVPVTSKKPKLK